MSHAHGWNKNALVRETRREIWMEKNKIRRKQIKNKGNKSSRVWREASFSLYHYPQEATRDHLARTRGGRNLGSRQFDYSLPRLRGTIDSKRRIDVGSNDSGLLPRARMRAKRKRSPGIGLVWFVNGRIARVRAKGSIIGYGSRGILECHSVASIRNHLSSSVIRLSNVAVTLSRRRWATITSFFSSVNIYINSQDYFIPWILRNSFPD